MAGLDSGFFVDDRRQGGISSTCMPEYVCLWSFLLQNKNQKGDAPSRQKKKKFKIAAESIEVGRRMGDVMWGLPHKLKSSQNVFFPALSDCANLFSTAQLHTSYILHTLHAPDC